MKLYDLTDAVRGQRQMEGFHDFRFTREALQPLFRDPVIDTLEADGRIYVRVEDEVVPEPGILPWVTSIPQVR